VCGCAWSGDCCTSFDKEVTIKSGEEIRFKDNVDLSVRHLAGGLKGRRNAISSKLLENITITREFFLFVVEQ
jgi:hypothetical protein